MNQGMNKEMAELYGCLCGWMVVDKDFAFLFGSDFDLSIH